MTTKEVKDFVLDNWVEILVTGSIGVIVLGYLWYIRKAGKALEITAFDNVVFHKLRVNPAIDTKEVVISMGNEGLTKIKSIRFTPETAKEIADDILAAIADVTKEVA